MEFHQLKYAELWATSDQGDVIYSTTKQWLDNEFPTQTHIRFKTINKTLYMANDDFSIKAEFKNVVSVDAAVIAFSCMLDELFNMTSPLAVEDPATACYKT